MRDAEAAMLAMSLVQIQSFCGGLLQRYIVPVVEPASKSAAMTAIAREPSEPTSPNKNGKLRYPHSPAHNPVVQAATITL